MWTHCVFQAMLPRHWTRISELTGHSFQVESESFSLRNIMEAPLLKYKEDLEVTRLMTHLYPNMMSSSPEFFLCVRMFVSVL